MEDSNQVLQPANSSRQLTITSNVSNDSTVNNALPGVALGGFNTTSVTIDGPFPSFNFSHQAAQTSSLNLPIRTS